MDAPGGRASINEYKNNIIKKASAHATVSMMMMMQAWGTQIDINRESNLSEYRSRLHASFPVYGHAKLVTLMLNTFRRNSNTIIDTIHTKISS